MLYRADEKNGVQEDSVGRPRREEEDGGIVILINKADEKKKVRGDFVHNVQTNVNGG